MAAGYNYKRWRGPTPRPAPHSHYAFALSLHMPVLPAHTRSLLHQAPPPTTHPPVTRAPTLLCRRSSHSVSQCSHRGEGQEDTEEVRGGTEVEREEGLERGEGWQLPGLQVQGWGGGGEFSFRGGSGPIQKRQQATTCTFHCRFYCRLHCTFHCTFPVTAHFTAHFLSLHISLHIPCHCTFHCTFPVTAHFLSLHIPLHISCHCTFHCKCRCSNYYVRYIQWRFLIVIIDFVSQSCPGRHVGGCIGFVLRCSMINLKSPTRY